MSKWIAEFELEDGDTMPEHMDLEYKGVRLDFHCKLLEQPPNAKNDLGVDCISRQGTIDAIRRIHPIDTDYDCTLFDKVDVMYVLNDMPSATPQEPRWIPVSERLPEDGEIVLLSTKTDIVFVGRYFKDNTNAFTNVVTAWMPLPKPYREVEE